MQPILTSLFLLCAFGIAGCPAVLADDLDRLWVGTFKGGDVNLVSIKKIELSKEKDGTLKARAWLVGFPDDVSLGEAEAEIYKNARTRGNASSGSPSYLLANFSPGKMKAVLTITPGDWSTHKEMKYLFCEGFLKNADGTRIYTERAQLVREP